MPDYNRIVLAGTLANETEIWSTSCAFTGPAGETISASGDLNQWAQDISDSLATLVGLTALGEAMGGNAEITEVRAYYYPTTTANATSVGIAGAATVGTGTANQPLQSSVVFSLRTPLAGRRTRGRMYWPALAIAPSNLGTYTTSTSLDLAVAAVDLLGGIGDAVPLGVAFSPQVVSGVGDLVTPVTSLSVGNIPDTQRRRRNSLQETYQTVPFA